MVAPAEGTAAAAAPAGADTAPAAAEVWEPDAEVAEPDPGGAPPERPWTLGGGEAAEEESFGAASVPRAPAGIGDRSGYAFEEFSLSADEGFEAIKVNVGSGNLFVRSKMAELASPGVPAVAYQVYNSLHVSNVGDVYAPWFTDYAMTGLFIESGREVRFFDGTGTEWPFTRSGSAWVAPAGLNASLAQLGDGRWRLTYDRTGERITFNSYGWPTNRQDRNGVGISYGWDDFGMLTSITDAAGRQVSLTRTPDNWLASMSAAGRATTFSYAGGQYLTSVDAGGGRVAAYTMTTGERVGSITRDGRTATFSYDSRGRVTRVTLSRSGEASQVTSFAYGADSTTVTDPRGGTVVYRLEASDRVTSVRDQRGRTRSQTWTSNSDVETTTDALGTGGGQGNVTTTTYDELNNATGIVMPTGAATQAIYAQGPDCQTAQSGHPYLPKCAVDDAGNRQSFTYDSAGNPTRVSDATSGGTGASFSYTYQGSGGANCGGKAGQICTASDGNGNLTRYAYDTSGNLVRVTPPAPLGATTYAYDAVGRVTAVTDGNGHRTRYVYDAADRITRTTYHNGQTLTTVYNGDGTVASETDSAGGHISYAYNLAGLQTRQAVTAPPSGGISGTVTMGYDASGNLTSYDDGTGITRYRYDAANQLFEMTEPGGTCPGPGVYPGPGSGCTKFDYDRNGNEVTRIFPGAARVDITRDAAGRMARMHARSPGGATRVDIRYGYATAGDADRTQLQTRTSAAEHGIPAGAVTTYSYDSLNRLTRAQERHGSQVNATFAYAYERAGNRTSQTQTGDVGDARRGTITYFYNAANQITATSDDAVPWAYDKAGNETSSGVRDWTQSYGDRGQLTSIDNRAYTTFGQGNARTLRAHTTDYLLSPLGVTRERSTLDGTTARTTRTPDGQVLGPQRPATEYYVTDHQGSVVALFTDAGAWRGGYSYTPYGERRDNGPNDNNWRYIGGNEEIKSFYRLSARYYSAATGRFTQMDPTGREPKPYTYAQNNPCNNVDWTGTDTLKCVGARLGQVANLASDAVSTVEVFVSIGTGNVPAALLNLTLLSAEMAIGDWLSDVARRNC